MARNMEILRDKLLQLQIQEQGRISNDLIELYEEQLNDMQSQLQCPKRPAYILTELQDKIKENEQQRQLTDVDHLDFETEPQKDKNDVIAIATNDKPQRAIIDDTVNLQKRLEQQKQAYEQQAQELADLADRLKQSAQAVDEGVEQRGENLDLTDEALDKSANQLKQINKQVKNTRVRFRMSWFRNIFLLLMIALVFVGMFIFIKSTQYAEYIFPTFRVPRQVNKVIGRDEL